MNPGGPTCEGDPEGSQEVHIGWPRQANESRREFKRPDPPLPMALHPTAHGVSSPAGSQDQVSRQKQFAGRKSEEV